MRRFCGCFQAAEDGDEPGGHRSYISAALQTGLCDWSAKYFAQPVMKVPPLSHASAIFRSELIVGSVRHHHGALLPPVAARWLRPNTPNRWRGTPEVVEDVEKMT